MLNQMIEKLKQYPKIPENLLFDILRFGIPTGSKSWGISDSNSDFDFIIPPNFPHSPDAFTPYGIVSNPKVEYPDFGSIYIYNWHSKSVFNLIFLEDPKTFIPWKRTTYIFTHLIMHFPVIKEMLRKKEKRIILFRAFLKIFYED